MRYDILSQLEKSARVVCEIDGPPPDGTGVEVIGDIKGRIELSPTGEGNVIARGVLRGEAGTECSRCLKPVPYRLEIELAEPCVLRQIDDPEEYETGLDEDDLVPILDEETVDLSELVRQLIAVDAPLSPVCSEDCQGLCVACGANLNEGDCGCPEKPTDPRWDKLKELLDG